MSETAVGILQAEIERLRADNLSLQGLSSRLTARNDGLSRALKRTKGQCRTLQAAANVAKAAPPPPYSFVLEGGTFTGMSLSRVAEYMAALGDLSGPGAQFAGMSSTEIHFREESHPISITQEVVVHERQKED
jgi:hypothetical protein